MRDRGIRQRKSLGQVFLRAEWPIRRIVDTIRVLGPQHVLEIGPGGGVLTRALVREGFQVTALEKDDRFADQLRNWSEEMVDGALDVRACDVLKEDLAEWVAEAGGNGTKKVICGNIPYNISSPILMKILPLLPDLSGAVLMTQLEFAKRLGARPQTKDYGSLTVFTQLRSSVEVEFEVPRSCFKPVPKVDSAVVTLRSLADRLPEDRLLATEKVCRLAFQQRRKQLRNSIRPLLGDLNPEDSPVDLSLRADTLAPRQFVRLAEWLVR